MTPFLPDKNSEDTKHGSTYYRQRALIAPFISKATKSISTF